MDISSEGRIRGNAYPPKKWLLSGGIVSDYEVSGTYYRAHVFTGSGTFVVSDTGTGEYPSTVEYLVVAGGGGGGARGGGNMVAVVVPEV